MWLVQVVAQFVVNGISIKGIFYSLFTGGWGPGSYFVPIIIQATLILPLIYLLCRKSLTIMTIVLFVISIAFEIVCLQIDMSESIYRLLVIRYLFALTLGVWLALNGNKINYKWLISLAFISLVYITGVNYFDLVLIMERFWLSQHAPSYFWTLLLIVIALNVYQFKGDNIGVKLGAKIGQASYHIFLMQMFYFWGIARQIPDMPGILYLAVSVVVCLILGLLFFEFENLVRKVIKTHSANKNAA